MFLASLLNATCPSRRNARLGLIIHRTFGEHNKLTKHFNYDCSVALGRGGGGGFMLHPQYCRMYSIERWDLRMKKVQETKTVFMCVDVRKFLFRGPTVYCLIIKYIKKAKKGLKKELHPGAVKLFKIHFPSSLSLECFCIFVLSWTRSSFESFSACCFTDRPLVQFNPQSRFQKSVLRDLIFERARHACVSVCYLHYKFAVCIKLFFMQYSLKNFVGQVLCTP
jgi:hypothetical protein